MSNPSSARPLPVRLSPRPLRAAWRAAMARRAVEDRHPFRCAVTAAFWPAVTGSGLLLVLVVNVLMRGHFVGWDGLHTIPTGGTR